MTAFPFSDLAIPGPVSDYLAEGASATEYQKTVRRAYQIFHQSEAHNYKNAAYAWRTGQEFLRVKALVRRGMFTAWKKNCGWASVSKIEHYMTLARRYPSEEAAIIAGPGIVAADVAKRTRR